MRTIIAGPRDYNNYEDLLLAIEQITWEITEVVSGGARGVDTMGERWAKEHNIPIKRFDADWKGWGKKAGMIRNARMANYVGKEGALLALYDYDKRSPGTTNMIEVATEKGLTKYVFPILR